MKKGFTLIELLIVIAILGTLSVVVLIALNPLQQLARTRDAGRQSGVTQIGRALEAYATSNNGNYVAENATWMTSLVTAGEIQVVPSAINYSVSGISACTTNAQNNLCYDASAAIGTGPIIVFARLESTSSNSKCTAPAVAWSVYSTADGRGGVVCSQTAPVAGTQTFAD